MTIVATIVIGFLVGLAARVIKPGNDRMGIIATTVVGIVGAFVGTYLGQALGLYDVDQAAGFGGGVLGAVVVLFALKMITGRL